MRKLEGPPFPEKLRYLYEWLKELEKGREYDPMIGPKPYSYPLINEWAHRMGRDPDPLETEMLIELGLVSLEPGILDKTEEKVPFLTS